MTALVTGGSRGLGFAIATALVRSGIRVAVVSRSPVPSDALHSYRGDVTDPGFMRRTIDAIEKDHGPLTLLVNNAGVLGPIGPLTGVPHDDWWRAVEVNLRGTAIAMQLALPRMCSRGRGRVINVVSGAAIRGSTYFSAYSAAKSAVMRLTEVAAVEVKPYGVSVFGMEPGTVPTDMSRYSCESEEGQRWIPWFRRYFTEGLTSTPEDVARRALDLASGRADALSGRYIPLRADLDEMIASAGRIEAEQLYALRITRLEPLPFIPAVAASEAASPSVLEMQRRFAAGCARLFSLWLDSGAVELRGTVREVVQNERIVYDRDSTIVTVLFTSCEDGCEVLVRQEGLPSPAARDAFIRGWIRCFDRLERLA